MMSHSRKAFSTAFLRREIFISTDKTASCDKDSLFLLVFLNAVKPDLFSELESISCRVVE